MPLAARLAALAAFSGALAAPVHAQPGMAQAAMKSPDGALHGTATFTQTAHGVLVDLDLAGLPPNAAMAIHVHEKGACDGSDGFNSAGGHFNPDNDDHGYHAKDGHHAGDMPNQFVASDGRLRSQIINTGLSLGKGAGNVFDADGSALVLHTKPDDHKSQPSGNAGERALCGVIVNAR